MTRPRALLSVLPLLVFAAACSTADAPPAATAESEGAEDVYAPTEAQRAEIVQALQTLFDALEAGDPDLLRSVMVEGAVMYFTEEDASGQISHGSSTVDQLAERIASSETPLIERMWDPVVRIDGTLATIWTEYDFYAGETFSHCGVDAATLIEREGAWKIAGLSWTRQQPPACPLHPDGPPSAGR